jgi:hypothetical protein
LPLQTTGPLRTEIKCFLAGKIKRYIVRWSDIFLYLKLPNPCRESIPETKPDLSLQTNANCARQRAEPGTQNFSFPQRSLIFFSMESAQTGVPITEQRDPVRLSGILISFALFLCLDASIEDGNLAEAADCSDDNQKVCQRQHF